MDHLAGRLWEAPQASLLPDDRDNARCSVQLLRLDRDRSVGRDNVRRVLSAQLCNDRAVGGQHVNRLANLDADNGALDNGDVAASGTGSESVRVKCGHGLIRF